MWVEVNEVSFDMEDKKRLAPKLINVDNMKIISDNGERIEFIGGGSMWVDENTLLRLLKIQRLRFKICFYWCLIA